MIRLVLLAALIVSCDDGDGEIATEAPDDSCTECIEIGPDAGVDGGEQ